MNKGTKFLIIYSVVCVIISAIFIILCFINKVNPFISYIKTFKDNAQTSFNNSFAIFTGEKQKLLDYEIGNNGIVVQNIDTIKETNYDYSIKSSSKIKNYAKIKDVETEIDLYDAYDFNIKTNIPVNYAYQKYYRTMHSYIVYGGFIFTLKFNDLYSLDESYEMYKKDYSDISHDDFKNYKIRYEKNSEYNSVIDFSDSNISIYKIENDEYELIKVISLDDKLDSIDNNNVIEIYDDYYSLFRYFGSYFVSLKISQGIYDDSDANNVSLVCNYSNFILHVNESKFDHNLLLPVDNNAIHYTQISLLNANKECFTFPKEEKLDFNSESVLTIGVSVNSLVYSSDVSLKFLYYNYKTNEYEEKTNQSNFLNIVEDYYRGMIDIDTNNLLSGLYKIIIEGNYNDGDNVIRIYDEYEYYFLFNNSEAIK